MPSHFTIKSIQSSACAARNQNVFVQLPQQIIFPEEKKKRRHPEDDLQTNCVFLFRLKYPQYQKRFFAIPNGGERNGREAKRMQATGTLPGVWDLFLSVPCQGYHGLFIEMKSLTGTLTDLQTEFKNANWPDYKFEVCNSIEIFEKIVEEYLK